MSFDIALSGIQAINEQLNTVSNNIANAATYGFKASRANFSSLMAGTQPNGVEIGSVTQNISKSGSTQTTGRSMDAAIDGRGFFISVNNQGITQYSRVGIFSPDTKGLLIDSNGNKVQGYAPIKNGLKTTGLSTTLSDIKIPTDQIPAVATTGISFVGNMSADWVKPSTGFDPADSTSYNLVKQSVAFDSLGKQHTISQYFVLNDTGKVDVYYGVDDNQPAAGASPNTQLEFNTQGQLAQKVDGNGQPDNTPWTGEVKFSATGAVPSDIKIDYTGTTYFSGEASTTTNRSDGYASGKFVGVELGGDGSVIAKYSNDQTQIVGGIAIATFANEGALTPVNETSWIANAESGAALDNRPGVGLAGKLSTGALEGSNVDITSELVGLMTSQRNYQANSKVLTSENQMMQALMQAM
jgi:flagellar hook protein FlgE